MYRPIRSRQRRVWRCALIVLVLAIAPAMNPAAQAGLIINPVFDSSWVTNNPTNSANATAVVNRVIGELENDFTNNVNMTIEFRWSNQQKDAGGAYENEPNNTPLYSLSQVETMFTNHAAASPQNTVLNTAVNYYPTSYNNPYGSSSFYMNDGEYMALHNGVAQNNDTINAYVTVGPDYFQGGWNGWNYGTTPVSNQIFLQGVLEHEITHAMGRIDYAFAGTPYLLPLDLYKYDPNTTTLDPGFNITGFSYNGGTTQAAQQFSNVSDSSDWKNAPGDSFNYSDGSALSISQTDLNVMYALGWDPPAPQLPPAATPEPCTLLLLGQGVALFGFAWRSQRKRRDEK